MLWLCAGVEQAGGSEQAADMCMHMVKHKADTKATQVQMRADSSNNTSDVATEMGLWQGGKKGCLKSAMAKVSQISLIVCL